MAIYKFDKKSNLPEIASGQWICPEPMLRNMDCGRPRLVTKTARDRVYWEEVRGKGEFADTETGYYQKKTVVYVADTKEEALRVFELAQARYDALEAAAKALHEQYDAKVDAILTKVES
jgi:hypothetical protein